MQEIIPILPFSESPSDFDPIKLILTVKSFDLQAIRKRYIASKMRNRGGRAGSVERRKPGIGGLIQLEIIQGKIHKKRILCRLKEPRAIDWDGQRFAFGAEDTIYIFENGEMEKIKYPWFSYIHTIVFSPHNPDHLLIASSGLDIIIEWDYKQNKAHYEWLAWEHGFEKAKDPITGSGLFLTRSSKKAESWEKEGKLHRLITHPAEQHLPTAERAAFINSVAYDPEDPNRILATFFHEGRVYAINKKDGTSTTVLANLKHPHGGRILDDNYMATSTGSGELVMGSISAQKRYNFKGLPGKASGFEGMEWIQNSIPTSSGFLSIDSNRNAFVQFNPASRKRCMAIYDKNWAVQDVVPGTLPKPVREALRELDQPTD